MGHAWVTKDVHETAHSYLFNNINHYVTQVNMDKPTNVKQVIIVKHLYLVVS